MANKITRRKMPSDEVDKVAKLCTDDGCTNDDASTKLVEHIYPNGMQKQRNEGKAEKAKTCMAKLGLSTESGQLAALITGVHPSTACARIAVAKCLELMETS